MQDLNEILKEIWPRVRERHLFPELPAPTCAGGEDRVGLDIKGKQISISRSFVEKMAPALEPREVVEGLLDHAVSHYLYCPWDFATQLRLYGEAKKLLKDRDLALKATDTFMDVVADTLCVSRNNTPLPNIYRHLDRGVLDEAIHALYQRIWGVDLGVAGHDEDVARKLARLPYLDRSRWNETIRRFVQVIEPLLKREEGSRESNKPNPMGKHGARGYSAQEIADGVKALAAEVDEPSEFREIFQDLKADLLEVPGLGEIAMGLGPGRSVDADLLYYMKLAQNYTLPIRKRPVEKSGSLYPDRHVPWEVGRPYQDIDPWTSFGKIMPGITQIWERREGEVLGEDEGTPDCIVVIDSSGSMTDPRKHLSYAVLGAACACEAYLRNGARVAVYNFSDAFAGGRRVLPYTDVRKDIYAAICHYYGGGTQLLVESIEDLQTDQVPDIFLITDMQITNLHTLIEYFNECKNRVTTVHVGDNKEVRAFRQAAAARKHVTIYPVGKKEDIPRIVLGKLREYMATRR
jgi:hypothetical protein